MPGPVFKFKTSVAYGVSLNVWERDGKYSYSIEKSYKKENGEYENTNVLFDQDLAAIALLIPRALKAIDGKRMQDAKKRKEPQGESNFTEDDIPF